MDLVPEFLATARERHPGLDLRQGDISQLDLDGQRFDYVLASGIFEFELKGQDTGEHIRQTLGRMFALSTKLAAADFMTTYVDFTHPGAWHTDPGWALAEAKKLSRRVTLRHDYLPFEFALFIYRQDEISANTGFKAVEEMLAQGGRI